MQELRKLIRIIRLWRLALRIALICLLVLATFYSITYLYILSQGGPFIARKLEGLAQRKVTLSSFHITPLLNLTIGNLDIEGVGRIDTLYLTPSVWGFLTRHIAFRKVRVVRPQFAFARSAPATKEAPVAAVEPGVAASAPVAPAVAVPAIPAPETVNKPRPQGGVPLNLTFKQLSIEDGTVNFIDHPTANNEIKITLKEINFSLNNFYLPPSPVATNFNLKAKIPWREGSEEGKIDAEGWINLEKRDMAASVKINDIDGIYLYPYYAQWVDLDKTRIEKAKLNFTSNINGVDNNVTAECHLELTDIVRTPRPPGEGEEKAEKIAEAVLDIFKALNQGKVVLDFTIRTKMDRPEFGIGLLKTAVEDKLIEGTRGKFEPTGIFLLPAKLVEGTIRSATDISKAVIDGTFAVGNEFKKAIQDSFRKQPKK